MEEEELTADRWMQLLDDVREELGEGTIGGIAFGRRLEFSSPRGSWELKLLEGPLGHQTQYRFFGNEEFPAAFYLGPAPDPALTGSWVEVETGDEGFDAECTVWSAEPHAVRQTMSDSVRRSIKDLWTFHPSLWLFVHSKNLTMVLPGVLVDRAGIIDLLLVAGTCVEELLKSPGAAR